ncbi:MAG: aminotransferase class V-fold PLP-dependent enzyme [Planctomycetota bacterium]
MPTLDEIRSRFPALQHATDVFLDNAGGGQVPASVADAIHTYMLHSYVQVGADYTTSRRATDVIQHAHDFVSLLMNTGDAGVVTLGSSTTVLCNMIAECYGRRGVVDGRDEIVIAETAHEANAGCWQRLGDRGFTVRTWSIAEDTTELRIDDLKELLSERTMMVAVPQVSNVLGRIEDVRTVTQLAHAVGARVCIDGVAFAPHRAIDVQAIGCDWYVYSTYKVFGPHMAAIYGSHDAYAELEGPNHYFIDPEAVPYKFEPGGPSHEGCAGLLGLWPHLAFLAEADEASDPSRPAIEQAFQHIAELETQLSEQLLGRLNALDGVRVIGPESADATDRVCTISFTHERLMSREIAVAANEAHYGIRYGHFYAHRLCSRLTGRGWMHDPEDGVVRTSLVHYNTPSEIDELATLFEALLA